MGLGRFLKNNAGLIGSIAGTAVAGPGVGTAIGGALGSAVANSGRPRIPEAPELGHNLASFAQQSLSPNLGVDAAIRLASNSSGSIADHQAAAAQQGLSRSAGTSIASRRFEAARRRGASDAFNALSGFQLAARGQALGALGQLESISAQQDLERSRNRVSFLNQALSAGGFVLGEHLGARAGLQGTSSSPVGASSNPADEFDRL